ncbi:hypothetical protein IJ22_15710 [Paenibacillus naphthalenovorans]|uniref:Uncharacterized protein n=1 Tax=Paenibacillus naphthalenovorans TaxID=162209 RepID=A0A0U2IM34_9BACL|nr:hypothetical protein IJ22_15710 [Paenibacillus naphthalenovorans]
MLTRTGNGNGLLGGVLDELIMKVNGRSESYEVKRQARCAADRG